MSSKGFASLADLDLAGSYHDGLGRFEEFLQRVRYKDGWSFRLRKDFLMVTMPITDSLSGTPMLLTHSIYVDRLALTNERSMGRWLLERIFDIEKHEACEFFLVDGAAPFFPDHDRPYALNEREEPVPINRPLPGESFPRIPSSPIYSFGEDRDVRGRAD